MLVIENGRKEFFQWDTEQRLIIDNEAVEEVHYTNMMRTEALVCEVFEENGIRLANVPNILLQEEWNIKAYACCFDCVREYAEFDVVKRKRPADYVYTETEIKRYNKLEDRLTTLENKEESVLSVNDKKGNVVLSASDVGALATTGGTVKGSVTLGSTAESATRYLTITKQQSNYQTSSKKSQTADVYMNDTYGLTINYKWVDRSNKTQTGASVRIGQSDVTLTKPLKLSDGTVAASTRSNLNVYSKDEIDSKGYLTEHQDLSNYYTKAETETAAANILTTLGEKQFAGVIENNTDGYLATTKDAAEAQADIKLTIEPKQAGSGEPSPSNIRTLSGWNAANITRCGKNLIGFNDYTLKRSAYTDACKDGLLKRTITTAHTTTAFILNDAIPYMKSNYFPPDIYIFTIKQTSTGQMFNSKHISILMELEDGTTVNIPNGVLTEIKQSGKIIGFPHSSSPTYNAGTEINFTIQLESGSTATEHEPYTEEKYNVPFGDNTIYYGEYDGETGILTAQRYALITFDGTETIEASDANRNSVTRVFTCSEKMDNLPDFDNEVRQKINSNMFIASPSLNFSSLKENNFYWGIGAGWRFGWGTTQSTAEEFKAFLRANPLQILVPLIPQEEKIQLEPQQIKLYKSNNSVWSDCGKTELTYLADTKAYIDNKFNELTAALVAGGEK